MKALTRGKLDNAENLYDGIIGIKATQDEYTPQLLEIIKGDFMVNLDSVKSMPQVITLKTLATEINNATDKINSYEIGKEGSDRVIFEKIESESENIGKFEHTINSVQDRINKTDTWGVIFLCLFIDLLVPLFIYLMIRRKEGDEAGDNNSFWDKLTGKKKPTTF